MMKNKGPQKGYFVVFQGAIPAWLLGRHWAGSQAQKHLKVEAWIWIFRFFRIMRSPSLETLWKYFVCSMDNKLIVLDVQFTVVFAQAGGKPTVDSSSMITPQ